MERWLAEAARPVMAAQGWMASGGSWDSKWQAGGRQMTKGLEISFASRRPVRRQGHRRLWLWLVAVLALLYGASTAVYWLTEWRWFASLGQSSVLRLRLLAPWAVGLVTLGLASAWLYANWRWAAGRASGLASLPSAELRASWALTSRGLLGLALVAAMVPARDVAGEWQSIWLYFQRQSFSTPDPVFGRDVAFYVFELPVWWLVWRLALELVLVAALGALVVHLVAGVLDLGGYLRSGGLERLPVWLRRLPQGVRLHLWLLGGLLGFLLAVDQWLRRFELLFANASGRSFVGPGYADLTVKLPAYAVLALLWLGVSVLFLFTARRGPAWWPLAGVAATMAAAFVLLVPLPALVQQYRVRPNELRVEKPYIGHNIVMTRRAFALDDIRELEYEPQAGISRQQLAASQGTLDNIRLWDWRSLLATFRQLQVIRTYYDFLDVDIDRYRLGSGQRQVELAVRELASWNLQNPTWVNRRLEFTHGFGLVVAPVNEVEASGLPVLWVRDIPPRLAPPFDRPIAQPRIYVGEAADDTYVIVGSATGEFDYPAGAGNVRTRYDGADGVRLSGLVDRLLFAVRFGESEILFASGLGDDSRILFHRRLSERLQRLAPFLVLDRDPYAVVTPEGRTVWVVDAYAVSHRYPYAQRVGGGQLTLGAPAEQLLEGQNYVRNSVKAIVNAYDGSVTFYVVDQTDPIIRAWRGVYPSLFEDAASLPADLAAHWRYPEALFRAQAEINLRYHMVEPETFYNAEDLWEIPRQSGGGDRTATLEPYYVTMQLRDSVREEFVLILPFTPAAKENMIAWLAARCDPEHYGELVLYRLAKGRLVLGPQQIDARIDQDPEISAQFTLWSQRGSRVIRGNLLVIPMADAILYVEPIYLQAEESALPQLAQVVVASGERVVMRATLQEALTALVAGRPAAATERGAAPAEAEGPPPTATPAPTATPPPAVGRATTPLAAGEGAVLADLVQEAIARRDAAERALQAGDWQAFGREMAAVDAILDRLAAALATATPGAP